MGIFSKKSKDTARAMFYDGELQGFTANTPCTFRADITDLLISRINPVVQAAQPLERIKTAEIMPEADYMRLHKGVDTAQVKLPRWTLRIVYTAQDGAEKELVFWFVTQDYKGVKGLVELIQPAAPASYTL